MTVAQDGSGDFRRLSDAVAALPPEAAGPVTIRIGPGVYREKVRISRPGVRLVGAGRETTVVTGDDHALRIGPAGVPLGTFGSWTLLVEGDGFAAEGLTVENTAGPGTSVGQAVAAYVDADRVSFVDCGFRGRQDTLFTGPLPSAPLTGLRFGSPRDDLPRRPTRQFYRRCRIAGDVDFIFGSAAAVFEDCDLVSLPRPPGQAGWITAASTPEGQTCGYVFLGCRVTGGTPGSVFLGRPWRDHARTWFVGCDLGPGVAAPGWDDWGKAGARAAAWYAEEDCRGPGSRGPRPGWIRAGLPVPRETLTPAALLAGADGWNPESV